MNSYLVDQFSGYRQARGPVTGSNRSQEKITEPLLNAEVETNDFGEHLTVREWYSTPKPCDIDPSALRLLFPPTSRIHDSCVDDPNRWVFLDIETTGITKGKGAYAFFGGHGVVGLGWLANRTAVHA